MLVAPVSVKINEENHKFGKPRKTKDAPDRRHNGVDYEVDKGMPVKASAGGRVVCVTKVEGKEEIVIGEKGKKKKKFTGAYGNVVIIYYGQDIKTLEHTYLLYAHLDSTSVRVDEKVWQYRVIGRAGRSGTSLDFYKKEGGYKLHFEVIVSKSELSGWRERVKRDYGRQEQQYRVDPERFLGSSFKALSLQVKNPDNYSLSLEVRRALSSFSDYIGKDKVIVVTGGDRPIGSDVGAKSTSQHVLKKAADIKVLDQSHLKTANQALNSGLFNGIGWYEEGYRGPNSEGPHVHVDLREKPARWGFDKNGEPYHGSFPKF